MNVEYLVDFKFAIDELAKKIKGVPNDPEHRHE